jgi:hypothetical protein
VRQRDDAERRAHVERLVAEAILQGPERRPFFARWKMRVQVRIALSRATTHSPALRQKVLLLFILCVAIAATTFVLISQEERTVPTAPKPLPEPTGPPSTTSATTAAASPSAARSSRRATSHPGSTPSRRAVGSPTIRPDVVPSSAAVPRAPSRTPTGPYVAVRVQVDASSPACRWALTGSLTGEVVVAPGQARILIIAAGAGGAPAIAPSAPRCSSVKQTTLSDTDVDVLRRSAVPLPPTGAFEELDGCTPLGPLLALGGPESQC